MHWYLSTLCRYFSPSFSLALAVPLFLSFAHWLAHSFGTVKKHFGCWLHLIHSRQQSSVIRNTFAESEAQTLFILLKLILLALGCTHRVSFPFLCMVCIITKLENAAVINIFPNEKKNIKLYSLPHHTTIPVDIHSYILNFLVARFPFLFSYFPF